MSQDSHCEEEKPFLDEEQLESSRHVVTTHTRRDRKLIVVLATATVISWLVTVYLLLSRAQCDLPSTTPKENSTSPGDDKSHNSYWPTDLAAMRPSIDYEERVFTGALYYDESARVFVRNTTSGGPEFVGPPSDAIDEAWEALLKNEFAPFTEQESMPFRPRLKTFNGQYRFEPDVFHSLHCVNELRKRIDADYYTQPERHPLKIDQADWDRIHIDHCIDQLRQTVMCFGDLSPVPLYSWEGAPLGIGQGTTHTCRKWDPLRQWVDQRHIEMNDA